MPRKGDPTWGDLRLGITVAVVLALVTLGVFFAGSKRGPFLPDRYRLTLDLADAGGIRVGSPVRVGGLPAGEVVDLVIVAPGTPPPLAGDTLRPIVGAPELSDIRLTLEIEERFHPYVTTSSRAQLTSLGLGGERFVQISAGDVREPPLPPGAEIPSVPSVDWDLLVARLGRALSETAELSVTAGQVRGKVFSETGTMGLLLQEDAVIYDRVETFQERSKSLLDLLEGGRGIVPRYAGDTVLQRQVDSLAATLRFLAADLSEDSLALARWADPVELNAALTDLRASIERLDARLARGDGSLGRFLYDEELSLQLRVLQQDVARLVAAFKEDPLGFVRIRIF